jgi:hypothetical protein
MHRLAISSLLTILNLGRDRRTARRGRELLVHNRPAAAILFFAFEAFQKIEMNKGGVHGR